MEDHRINMTLRCENGFHFRPAALLDDVINLFPQTDFFVSLTEAGRRPERSTLRNNYLQFVTAEIRNGETVVLEASGTCPRFAAEMIKTVWENFDVIGVDSKDPNVKGKLFALLERRAAEIDDPAKYGFLAEARSTFAPDNKTAEKTAVADDGLHKSMILLIPQLARRYACSLEIMHALPRRGIKRFTIQPGAETSVYDIYQYSPEAGSEVTVVAHGSACDEAADMLCKIFENMIEADELVRKWTWDHVPPDKVVDMLTEHFRSRPRRTGEEAPPLTLISRLLYPHRVVIDPGVTDKESVLGRLSDIHASQSDVMLSALREQVVRRETTGPSMFPGLLDVAIPHARMKTPQKISLVMGVFSQGVPWSEEGETARIVLMFMFDPEYPRTWRDYFCQSMLLFRSNATLVEELCHAHHPEEALEILSSAERRMLPPDHVGAPGSGP